MPTDFLDAELEVKIPHPRGPFQNPPRPAPQIFSKATIREGYSGAEREKKILRYFACERRGAGRDGFFLRRAGRGGGIFCPNL